MSENSHASSTAQPKTAVGSVNRLPSRLQTSQWLVIVGAVVLTVALRFIDTGISNLSSMAALALFCGSVFRHPAALLIPIVVRVATDVMVSHNTGYSYFPSWPFDYSAYLLIGLLGHKVSVQNRARQFGGAIAAVAVYFVFSNFGVWLLWPESYPRTIAGLANCYYQAIPFAKGTLLGNVVAVPLFYNVWNAVTVPTAGTIVDSGAAAQES